MMRRAVAILLAVLVVLGAFLPIASSSRAEVGAESAPSFPPDVAAPSDYATYLAQEGAGLSPAEEGISLDATAFVLDDGAGVTVAEDVQGADHPVVRWTSETGSLTYEFDVPRSGLYGLELVYLPLPGRGNPVELAFRLDGTYRFAGMKSAFFPRRWRDAGEVRKDGLGNEFAPEQEEAPAWTAAPFRDPTGLADGPFRLALQAGRHTLTIEARGEPFALDRIVFPPPVEAKPYADVVAGHPQGTAAYDGEPIPIPGEAAAAKTTRSMIPKSDNRSPLVHPADPVRQKINYIGSYSWEKPGERISWEVDVPRTGLYRVQFRFRQSYVRNIDCYRTLTVDGAVPFSEAEAIPFPYTLDWAFGTLGDGSSEMFLLLEEGTRTLALEVTLGPLAEFSGEMQKVLFDLGDLYRSIVMITGEIPDPNRDYALFEQIPDLRERLVADRERLIALAGDIERIAGSGRSSDAVVLRSLANVIERMLAFDDRAQDYKQDFYNAYASASAWMYEMRNMPLDIDEIVLCSPDRPAPDDRPGFLGKTVFSVRRFLSSFFTNYNDLSQTASKEALTIWVNWGRDQALVLDNLSRETFTRDTGIPVRIRIVNASLIQAILSGNAPDLSLTLSRTQPVNLAMRGALHDLSSFEDFPEVADRFMPGATVPYEYGRGCYGLPDSQQFFVLFYRTDIFQELGLAVPKTWQEFFAVAAVLERNNLQAGVPYTQITDIWQTDAGIGALNLYPSLLLQFGTTLYNEERTATTLSSPPAIGAFRFWTDMYTQYRLPVTYDFYNRFRTGEMPIAIASYTEYARLTVAAPEINDRWAIAPIPGFPTTGGAVSNLEAGSGTACVILSQSKRKDEAWEYLKWWTSRDTQSRYCNEIESMLGIAGRYPTSNVEAFRTLAWKREDLDTLLAQWSNVREIPEIPGGYFAPRAIDNAFWNVVVNSRNPRETLVTWSVVVDYEIARKRREYGDGLG